MVRSLPTEPGWSAFHAKPQAALVSASIVGHAGHAGHAGQQAQKGRELPTWRPALQRRQWWYIAPSPRSPQGTSAEGPWTRTLLQQAIQGGVIEGTRLVWSPGMETWQPAGQQDEFAFYFPPPPLPAA